MTKTKTISYRPEFPVIFDHFYTILGNAMYTEECDTKQILTSINFANVYVQSLRDLIKDGLISPFIATKLLKDITYITEMVYASCDRFKWNNDQKAFTFAISNLRSALDIKPVL